MITFKDYQTIASPNILGRVRKQQSDLIMDATFTNDIQYQVGYFFDYYHTTPDNRLRLENYDPGTDPYAAPADIKFIAHSKKTYEKDEVTMHIQFRPGHECAVDYYDVVFGKRYNARYPVGLIIAPVFFTENPLNCWKVLRVLIPKQKVEIHT